MILPPDLPAHLAPLQGLIDDCTSDELSLINAYIVDRAKQLQADNRAEHMAQFKPGNRVRFSNKQGEPVEAIVVRPNKKTVTLMSDAGTKWNVSPELLHKIEDTGRSQDTPVQLSLVQGNDEKAWVGGLIDAPGYITGEPGAPYCPKIFAWLNEIGQVIRISLTGPDDPEPDLVQELKMAIAEPAAGKAGAPSHIRVNDAEQTKTLQAAFPSINVVCADTPELNELQSTMQKQMALTKEMTYSETGASADTIGELFDAAAALYRAKPWDQIPHDQSLTAVSIEALGVKHAPLSVMGQMGQHFGIILFNQLIDHERYTLLGEAIHKGVEPDYPPHSFLSFDPAKEVDKKIRADITRHGWTVANAKAYPILMAPVEGKKMRPITPYDLTLFSLLARALTSALSNQDFIASHTYGPSTKIKQMLPTDSGPVEVVFEVPYPYAEVMQENGAQDSIFARLIAMERTSDDLDWDLHDKLSTELQEKYMASPEARATKHAASVSTLVMSFSFNYLNCTVATLAPADLEQILYDIIPQKVMMPASEAVNMIEDARAFFSFLARAYQSVHASRCLSILNDDAASKMAAAMNDPSQFGMGKSMLSDGTSFPFDLPGFPPEIPGPSATKPKPKDKKTRKKQRAAARKARKKSR